MDNYYKELFLSNYRTEKEAQNMKDNADEFAMWLCANPEYSEPLFKWFINLYFNGLDEYSTTILFEEDLIRCAKNSITKPLFIDTTAQGMVANYSIFGIMCCFFKEPYNFDKDEMERVYSILNEIKIRSELFIFKSIDWEYFIDKHWYEVTITIFNELASDFNKLKDGFLIKLVNDTLIKMNCGLVCEYIAKDDNFDPPHSGFGIDFSKCFKTNNKPLTIEFECTRHANSYDSDLATESLV